MFLLIAVISALLYSSLVEYCLHRFILHRSYEQDHVKNHHRIFHGLKSYEFEDINTDDVLSSVTEIFRNVVLYLPPTLIIFLQSKYFGALFLVVCLFYNFWEELVHLNFHRSRDGLLSKLKVFDNLKEHHRVHHYIYNSNYGIGTSFWDSVFKTKKVADNNRKTAVL